MQESGSHSKSSTFVLRTLVVALLVATAVGIGSWVNTEALTDEDKLAQAAQAVQAGEIENAYQIVRELHDSSPSSEVVSMLAAIEGMRGNPAEALDLILSIPGYDSDPNLLMNAGRFALEVPRLAVARDVLTKAIDSFPGNVDAIRMLSNLEINLMNSGEVRRLIALLDQMDEATAEDILLFCSGDRIRYDEYENIKRLVPALANEPNQGNIAYALSVNYVALNRLAEAAKVVNETRATEGVVDAWLLDLASAELAIVQGEYGSALATLQHVDDDAKMWPAYWLLLGRALREEGFDDQAVIAYENAAILAPYDPEPAYAIFRLLHKSAPEQAEDQKLEYQRLKELNVAVNSVVAVESLEQAVDLIPGVVGLLIDNEAWREARACLNWLRDEGYRSFEATEQEARLRKLAALPPLRLPMPNPKRMKSIDLNALTIEN